MIVSQILIVSLIMIYVSWYLAYQTLHSNANDVQDKIDHAITRLARDAGVPRSQIKQKFFMKRHVNITNATTLKTSTNLK